MTTREMRPPEEAQPEIPAKASSHILSKRADRTLNIHAVSGLNVPSAGVGLELARDLLAAGIPVVICPPRPDWKHGDTNLDVLPPAGWSVITAAECDLSPYRAGIDTLALVGGHGVDVVDSDPKNGGSLNNMPPFRRFGRNRTPSGGTHDLVRSTGICKISPLTTSAGHVGDYVGGTAQGGGRALAFLPGSSRPKYPDAVYEVIEALDLHALLESDPDEDLVNVLDACGGTRAGLPGKPAAKLAEVRAFLAEHSAEPLQECAYGRAAMAGMLQDAQATRPGDTKAGRHAWAVRSAARCVELIRTGCAWSADLDTLHAKLELIKPEGGSDWTGILAWALNNADSAVRCSIHNPTRNEAATAWQAAQHPTPGHPANPDRFFDKREGLLVATLAEQVERSVGPFANGPGDTLWVFRGGVYVDDGEQDVRRVVVNLCGERYRDSYLRNVLQVLKAGHTRVTLLSGTAKPDDRYLNLPNGLLDWRTSTLLPHDPDVPSVHRIPVRWDPRAKCPLTDRFLRDIFGDDDEMIAFVEEIVGAVLYAGHPFHQRAVMLLGEGKNGKGSFLAWLRLLVGDPNVSEVKPQALDDNRFASAQLYGKLANLAGDVAPTAFTNAERFKEITAGDVIQAEHKYGHPFSFHPVATVVASFNEMPATVDRSEGFFRRWIVLPFPHRFVDESEATSDPDERTRDPQAVSQVSQPPELSGFLNRAVAGLKRLHDRGDFDAPIEALFAMERFREYGDPVVAFLKEMFTADQKGFLSRLVLQTTYKDYCDANGVMPMSPARLYQHLPGAANAALGVRVEQIKRRGDRGFKGLDWKG
jgi:P4 family phage/plasmid primase-like protien